MTYRELHNFLEGYQTRLKEHWNMTRFQAYMVYCANAENPVSMDEFLPLGDAPVKRRKRLITKREYEQMQRAWN